MNEIIVPYNTVSSRRQEVRNRIQLIGASLCIVIGYSESFNIYTGMFIIVPIIGLAIVVLNIIFARFYRCLIKKYGDKFEIFLIKTNGIIMLTTGIGYQIAGSKYIQYAYYLLTVLFFVILPNFVLPAKRKRLVLKITPSKIIVQKRLRTIAHTWQNIDLICIQQDILQIKKKGNRKALKYYLDLESNIQAQLFDLAENIKSEYGYKFDLQKI